MTQRTAILVGATGLIGGFVLQRLLADKAYKNVKIFVRRKLDIEHPKLEQHVIDFDRPDTWNGLVKGDDLYCCIGTTMRNAGSKEAFYKVDHTYAVAFADAAAGNNVPQLLLVSSLGAAAGSSNFYLDVKGEVEEALRKMNFHSLVIFRPSMLLGPRKEFRLGEVVGKFFMQVFFFLFIGTLKRYRAIQAETVAKAMVSVALQEGSGVRVLESNEIQITGG